MKNTTPSKITTFLKEERAKETLKELEKHGEFTEETARKTNFEGRETNLVSQILNYFRYSDRYHLFRCNAGKARALWGTSIIHLAPKGTPDIIGFDCIGGRFIGIETKVKKNKLSPDQAAFAKKLRNTSHGIYIFARSLDDVFAVLEPREPLPF